VVLLSGGPGPVADMIATNHTAILLEQRGTGRSIPMTLDEITVSEALLVDDLEALRAALGYKKWTLLGHSFGTFTAMHYAIAHPAQTQSLILLATAPPRSIDDHFFDNMAARSTPEAKRRLEQIDLLKKTASVEDRKKLNEEAGMIELAPFFFDVQNSKPMLALPEPPATRSTVNRLLFKEYRQFDLTSDLRKLRIPVLILQGRQDPLDLEMAARTRDAIPGAKLIILERCGHFAWLEAADQLRHSALEFLSAQAN
jgi:proline iminopeptidase